MQLRLAFNSLFYLSFQNARIIDVSHHSQYKLSKHKSSQTIGILCQVYMITLLQNVLQVVYNMLQSDEKVPVTMFLIMTMWLQSTCADRKLIFFFLKSHAYNFQFPVLAPARAMYKNPFFFLPLIAWKYLMLVIMLFSFQLFPYLKLIFCFLML